MKRAMCALILSLFLTVCAIAAQAEGTRISVAGVTSNSTVCKAFAQAHPDVDMTAVLSPYLSTTELINDLLTGGFAYDTFVISSNYFDVSTLIEKGYCADLSGHQGIAETISQMTPAFANLVMRDGHIYGVPYNCRIEYMAYSMEAWEQLGLTEADVPADFGDFLTFLERWIDQVRTEGTTGYSVLGSFDEELYNETSYADFLVQLLMDNHILQCGYAQRPLRFSSTEFQQCLERCTEIGKELYQLEPIPNQGIPIFQLSGGMENLHAIVPLRMTKEQPALIKTNVNVCMVFADTKVKALAEEFALSMLSQQDNPSAFVYLFQNAQPLEDPGYADNVAFWEGKVAELQKEIDSNTLSPANQRDQMLELERFEGVLQDVSSEDSRYLISPTQLAAYQSCQDQLFIQPPHFFLSNGEGGEAVKSLRARYVSGNMTAEQFIMKLDEMAMMMEMEE